MAKVESGGGLTTVKADKGELGAVQKKSAKGTGLDHIDQITAKPTDNGGWHVECFKKDAPTMGAKVTPYVNNGPERYSFEDGAGFAQFVQGLVGGSSVQDAADAATKGADGGPADGAGAAAAGGADEGDEGDEGADADEGGDEGDE